MAQDVYDREEFFDEYIKLLSQVKGLDGAPEWPVLRSFIPNIKGKKFLDLGCSFGWYCRWARENGAQEVKGAGLSENTLASAKEFSEDAAVHNERADLESLKLPTNEYGVIFDSLTVHYMKNLSGLIDPVMHSLELSGSFIFSAEHTIWTAPRHPKWILDSEAESI